MSVLESILERRCCTWALKANGILNYKLHKGGHPDRIFLFKDKPPLFVEFKRQNGTARILQVAVHDKLKALGFKCHIIDNFKDFEQIVEEWLHE